MACQATFQNARACDRRGCSLSARAGWRRNGELTADHASCADRYLAMTRHWRADVESRVVPDRVTAALTQYLASMSDEMTFELLAPHAAAMSIVTCSAWPPPIGGSRPCSR